MGTDRSPAERADAYLRRVLKEKNALLSALDAPAAAQAAVLGELVAAARDTAFGREHGFAGVRDADDYRRATPIRGHEEFAPWLRRIAAGEQGVLTAEEPMAFFASSGTTGAEKEIPVTRGYLFRCFLPFYFAGLAQVAERHRTLVERDDAVLNLWQDPHSPTARTASGRPHIGPSQLDYGRIGEELAVGLGNRAPWSDLPERFRDSGPWERTYLRVRLAAEHDVRAVFTVNPAIAAALPYQLRLWWPRMVKEIHDGTLGGVPFREPNPARAKELEEIAARRGTLRPGDVWPRLEVLLTWTTYVARLYLPGLLSDYGPGARLLPAPIGSSEGPLAVPIGGSKGPLAVPIGGSKGPLAVPAGGSKGPLAVPADGYPTGGPLMLTSCFYEFVPAEEDIDPTGPTLLAHELEDGREYHVVLSHAGGLYRCATRDVVRVAGFAGATPRIEYSCRYGVLSAAGERLRESQVLRATAAAATATGTAPANLMVRVSPEPDGPPAHEAAVAFRDRPPAPDLAAFARALDAELGRESPGYARARKDGALAAPRLRPVPLDAFSAEFRRRVEAGERPPRVKDRVFPSSPGLWARITEGADDE
ncbi:hypothetical protein HNP84_005254 [Thermocatellispora tengchongensis]|uniref:GH3 auxin-responsive promoter n=1 Tax=Thermocatellispora tengchongensis TaxID=1073253 RepID=A0A840PDK4_9ACTN|nr:GH3 auxin-responsive promoter family protein [Thermocatellispora tengchongensis]MBB5135510.1 hypothetical protein [Thermocatellispora tengchongensis]